MLTIATRFRGRFPDAPQRSRRNRYTSTNKVLKHHLQLHAP